LVEPLRDPARAGVRAREVGRLEEHPAQVCDAEALARLVEEAFAHRLDLGAGDESSFRGEPGHDWTVDRLRSHVPPRGDFAAPRWQLVATALRADAALASMDAWSHEQSDRTRIASSLPSPRCGTSHAGCTPRR